MWHDFQKVSRDVKELHLESLIERKELFKKLKIEKEKTRRIYLTPKKLTGEIIATFTNELNKKIGILAMEVAKRNKDVLLLFYYYPKLSLAKEIVRDNSKDLNKIKSIRDLLDDPKQQLLEKELSYTEMFSYESSGKKEICAICITMGIS